MWCTIEVEARRRQDKRGGGKLIYFVFILAGPIGVGLGALSAVAVKPDSGQAVTSPSVPAVKFLGVYIYAV